MNHKVIMKQDQESSVSFVDVSMKFEIRSAPCFTEPLVVITLEAFSCLGLEELGHKKKKWKLFLQELFHLSERGGPRFVYIGWVQPFTKLFLPLTLFLVSTSFSFVLHSTLFVLCFHSSISGCYPWEPSCLFLEYPTHHSIVFIIALLVFCHT